METEEVVVKKQREPITMVFTAILLVAILIAVGIHVNDHVINKMEPAVTESSNVEVDYSGSFYDYYDKGGALFQTSVSSIEENSNYVHADSYSTGSRLNVDMSKSDFLAGFQNALLGLNVGDTVRVAIPAAEGYHSPVNYCILNKTVKTVMWSETQTVDVYDELGWTYIATPSSSGGYNITLTVKPGDEFRGTDEKFGIVKTTISEFTDDHVNYGLAIENAIAVKNIDGTEKTYEVDGGTYKAIQMVKVFDENGKAVSIIGVDDVKNPSVFLYEECEEKNNQDLYFEITVISISEQ